MLGMKVSISAGHNPDGKIACGVVAHLKESTQNRVIVKKLKKKNNKKGIPFTLIDCTVDNATSQSEHLRNCAEKHKKANAHVNIQIHFNSGGGEGCEVLVKDGASKRVLNIADDFLFKMESLGFKPRGIKKRKDLYMLNHVPEMMIIEICFADNKKDVKRYRENKKEIVKALFKVLKYAE